MSTRGVIARPAGDGWAGRYHHFDSYPSGLGETLWKLYRGHFAENLEAMQKFLIDDHPAGWSTVVGRDLRRAPGFGFVPAAECYCHGQRSEPAEPLFVCKCPSNGPCAPDTIQWAYVLAPVGLAVYKAVRGAHELVGLFPWDGEAPVWGRL